MARVRINNLNRLGADARRQIRIVLKSQRPTNAQSNPMVEDVSPSPSKMQNVRTSVDGYSLDSLSEARRYGELKIEEMAGIIANLEVHKPFRLVVNGIHICDYESDFTYRRDGKLVVEDVKSKGTITPTYRIKKKLLLAVLGITIQEVYDS